MTWGQHRKFTLCVLVLRRCTSLKYKEQCRKSYARTEYQLVVSLQGSLISTTSALQKPLSVENCRASLNRGCYPKNVYPQVTEGVGGSKLKKKTQGHMGALSPSLPLTKALIGFQMQILPRLCDLVRRLHNQWSLHCNIIKIHVGSSLVSKQVLLDEMSKIGNKLRSRYHMTLTVDMIRLHRLGP